MQPPSLLIIALLLSVAPFALASKPPPFDNLIENRLHLSNELPTLQSRLGPFSPSKLDTPTLRATYQAIYLSHLYGIQKNINTSSITEYLLNLTTVEPKFNPELKTIESLREFVLSCLYLNVPFSRDGVEDLVYSLYDPSKNLFSPTQGNTATIEATTYALDIISMLSLRDDQKFSALLPNIKKTIEASIKSTNTTKYFDFSSSNDTTTLENNAYAISAALDVGLQLLPPEPWNQHIYTELKKINLSDNNSYPTLSTSIHSLYKLAQFTDTLKSFQKDLTIVIDPYILLLNSINLEFAYHLDRVFPLTPFFSACFNAHSTYPQNHQDTKDIVQGQSVTPKITFNFANISHSSLSVELIIHTAGFTFDPKRLLWDENDEYALSEPIDTHNILGFMQFSYSSKLPLLECDAFIHHADELRVGYSFSVDPHAQLAGHSVHPGETVNLETVFSFNLHVQNHSQSQEDILSGPYDASLKLLDSSNVLIYEESKDCSSNSEPLSFSYTLNRYNIVPGSLCFLFQLIDHAIGLHNEHQICYKLSPIAVASHFNIEPKSPNFTYHLNQPLTITIAPASFPDLSSPEFYPFKDFHSNNISDSYNFTLNLYDQHQLVLSVPGTPFVDADQTLRYQFRIDSKPTLDLLVPLSAKFYYQPLTGPSVHMKLYNQTTNALFHDPDHFALFFDTMIEIRDLKLESNVSPLKFGDLLKLSFKLFDSISGLYVYSSSNQSPIVQVLWRLSKPTTSTDTDKFIQEATLSSQDQFHVHLPISLELPSGDFKLELVLKTESEHKPLVENDKPFHLTIHIDGNIHVQSTLVHFFNAEHSVQVSSLRFKLLSEETALQDARLLGTLFCEDTLLITHPVCLSGSEYAFSWIAHTKSLTSNNCRVELYTRKTQLGGDHNKKLFEQNLRCSNKPVKLLPINVKLFIFISLTACFFALSRQKWKIEKI